MRSLHSKPIPVFAIMPGVFALVIGCTHIVKRPVECAAPPPPTGNSAIAWQRVGGTRSVSGKVVAPGSLDPIPGASVGFAPLPIVSQTPSYVFQQGSDASGGFHIDSIPPSRYLMVVRRLGYLAVRDTVLVTPDSGIVVTGILVPYNMTLDECGMMYQKVRVPWWKRS